MAKISEKLFMFSGSKIFVRCNGLTSMKCVQLIMHVYTFWFTPKACDIIVAQHYKTIEYYDVAFLYSICGANGCGCY